MSGRHVHDGSLNMGYRARTTCRCTVSSSSTQTDPVFRDEIEDKAGSSLTSRRLVAGDGSSFLSTVSLSALPAVSDPPPLPYRAGLFASSSSTTFVSASPLVSHYDDSIDFVGAAPNPHAPESAPSTSAGATASCSGQRSASQHDALQGRRCRFLRQVGAGLDGSRVACGTGGRASSRGGPACECSFPAREMAELRDRADIQMSYSWSTSGYPDAYMDDRERPSTHSSSSPLVCSKRRPSQLVRLPRRLRDSPGSSSQLSRSTRSSPSTHHLPTLLPASSPTLNSPSEVSSFSL